MTLRRNLIVLVALTLRAASLEAGDGRIPIHQPTYIASPGVYYLTRDIASAGFDAITVGANDVTIDLAGHTITAANNVNGISCNGFGNLRVHGGRIFGGNNGIYVASPTESEYRFQDLSLSDQTFGVVVYAFSAAARVVVQDSLFVRSGLGLFGGDGGLVENNRVSKSTIFGGIYAQNATGLTIRGNTVTDGQQGISLDTVRGAVIEGNVVRVAAGSCFALLDTSYCTLSRNTATGAPFNGFIFSGAAGCKFNTLEGNVASGNAGRGFHIAGGSTGNVYSNNRSLGNTSANIFAAGNFSAGGNNDGGTNY